MQLAGAFSLLAGVLFLALPGRADHAWRSFLGAAWVVTGMLWIIAYVVRRRSPAR